MAQNKNINDNFVLIEGGKYLMGSPTSERQRDNDERQHEVTIGDFYCDPYEVTQSDYEKIMGNNPSYHKGGEFPVECVSWFNAIDYCNKKSKMAGLDPCYKILSDNKDTAGQGDLSNLKSVTWDKNANGYRLLTEEEWEYASRAKSNNIFITDGYITSKEANFYGCYPYLIEENYLRHTNKDVITGPVRDETTKVGSFLPNGFALYDTAGNVSEWCFNFYGEYGKNLTNGYLRVARGGGYNDFGKHLRSAYRSCYDGGTRNSKRGFRICRNKNATTGDDIITTNIDNSIKTSGIKKIGYSLLIFLIQETLDLLQRLLHKN